MANVLILDIETAPKIAYVWRFFKEHVGADQVLKHGHIMSFAAKWLGEDGVIYQENRKENDKKIVKQLIKLFDKADIVVAHNGVGFDFPQVMARALVHDLAPPSPYKVVDTLKVARKEFGFPSNSLAYLSKVLGVSEKKSHKQFPGFELWLECLRGNEAAWDEMREYNIQDVISLEEMYLKMRPWMRHHPNVAVFTDNEEPVCPKCGGKHLHFRGYAHTNVGKFHRFQCQDCGGWGRTRYTLKTKEQAKNILVHAVN